MYSNKDIEQMMEQEKENENTIKKKSRSVAKRIANNEKDVQMLAKRIERLWQKRRELQKNKPEQLKTWRDEMFELPAAENEVALPAVNIGGRPKKRLSKDISKRTEFKILDDLLAKIEDEAIQQQITPEELLHKLNERSLVKWKSNDEAPKSQMPVKDACALIYNVNFSLSQYQKLRLYMKDHSIFIPTRNEIDSYKKSLMCQYIVEATKTYCEFQELTIDTVRAIVALERPEMDHGSRIHVEAKFGIDGSGSHQIRHQLAEDIDENTSETSYIGAFWCPLSVLVNDKLIWSNKLPNSLMFCRPLCLLREKECRDSVLEHFKPFIDAAHTMESPSELFIGNEKVLLSINTELSMIDGKMVDIIQGDSGSFCHFCKVSRKEANDLTCILQGFSITKTVEEMSETWDKVEEGNMLYNDPDRAGQCHEPMNVKDLRFFAILHQKLRSLDNCLKLLYHLVSGQTHTWSECSPNVKLAVAAGKKEVIDHIRKNCGFLVDCPTKIGGNTNTGPIADRFFGPQHRDAICSVILKSSDREAFSKLLSYFNMILSITQQSDTAKVVKPESVKDLGQSLMIHYKQSFPFAMISPSVHQMCSHSWELFEMTNGKPIATYAEQSGEAWNKHIRSYKSGPAARARQCSIRSNIQDIFTRMLVQSHPIIASKKKLHQCSRCEKYGHIVRSCPKNYHSVLNEEKSFIESCYM